MARQAVKPSDYGIQMETPKFAKLILQELEEFQGGQWKLDKLVCRPSIAIEFCQAVRVKHGWDGVPDYVILEPAMNWRKKTREDKAKS